MNNLKILKRRITQLLSLILLIMIFVPLSVSAYENAPDWSTANWEEFNYDYFDYISGDQELKRSLEDYLLSEADISILFILVGKADGDYRYWTGSLLADRFMNDPEEVLSAVAKESSSVQPNILHEIVFGYSDYEEMAQKLEQLTFSGANAAVCYDLLAEMIAFAEELYGRDITNPKTADPLMTVVNLMTVSFICIAVTARKIRQI